MKKKFVLFAIVIMICALWILVLNRNKDEPIEQTNKKIPVVNLIKENIDENYVINRQRIEGNFEIEDVIYSDPSFVYDKSSSKVVSIYLVYKDYYEILYVDVNPLTTESIEISTEKNIESIYYAFVEYDVVGAITYSNNKSVQFLKVYESEFVKNTDVVGGNVVKRVFKQDKGADTSEEVSFVIYNAYSYDEITANTRIFGVYRFIIK